MPVPSQLLPSDLPPELMNSDPLGFAWGVWHDRTPRLLAQVRDAHPFGPAQRRALAALASEVASGVMAPLSPDAHDHDLWESRGAAYIGKPWLDTPFLWSESFFYRRLLEVTGYFGTSAWRAIDPFAFLKDAELADPALESDLAALDELAGLPAATAARAKLLASLWGNRADLGFQIGRRSTAGQAPKTGLITDHSAEFWSALGPAATVVLVVDNAGRELLADLILIDHLLEHGHAASVAVHVKPHPYYVSDATGADVLACLRRLRETPGSARGIAGRLHAAIAAGTISLRTHEFYCAPWSYHQMPADLAAEFGQASLTIFKGDLNYRRLTGDLHWPPTTSFTDVTGYFPSSVVALRVLKSDVITGLAPAAVAELDATRTSWRTDGSHGVLQTRTDPVSPR